MSGSLDDLESMLGRIEQNLRESHDLAGPSAEMAQQTVAGFAHIGATGVLAPAQRINELVDEIAELAGSARQRAEEALRLIATLRT